MEIPQLKGGEKLEKKKNSKKKIEKETRELKIMFTKTGTSSNTPRLAFPMTWIKDMNIDLNDREVEVTYHPRTKKISIRKKSSKPSKDDEE